MKFFKFILLTFICLSCATSPTGRKQLMLVPEAQMTQMGFESFQQIKKETPTETDPKINAYVKCVLDPVLKAAGPVSGVSNWDVVVFRSKEVNAFALPGGHIGVYTGILPVAKTPAQLAAVIGHEVGHVIARHGAERTSDTLVGQGAVLVAGSIAQKKNKNWGLIIAAIGAPAVQYGFILPFSRAQESEADIIGLDLMSRAGYDPRQAVDLWKNMSAATGGKQPPEILSTHPSNQRRINDITAHLPKVLPYYERRREEGNLPHCQM
jgi:predicted Zn-dependent protease